MSSQTYLTETVRSSVCTMRAEPIISRKKREKENEKQQPQQQIERNKTEKNTTDEVER